MVNDNIQFILSKFRKEKIMLDSDPELSEISDYEIDFDYDGSDTDDTRAVVFKLMEGNLYFCLV